VAVSSAARTPSIIEQDVQITFPATPAGSPLPVVAQEMGNKNIAAERVKAYEIGFRHQLRRNLSTDVAAFFNDYSKLTSYVQGQPYIDTSGNYVVVPITPENVGAAETKGVEVSADWRPTSNWRLAGNFSWLHVASNGAPIPGVASLDDPGRNPTHQWHLRSEWQVTSRLALDSAIYSVAALPSEGIPAYTRADVRLGWRLQERMELSIGGKNLLDPRHAEFVSESYPQNSLTRRSFYTKLMWAF
jgi:iron complex outermembrane receptor protein